MSTPETATAQLDVEEKTQVLVFNGWSQGPDGVRRPVVMLSLLTPSGKWMNVALRASDALEVSSHLKKRAKGMS